MQIVERKGNRITIDGITDREARSRNFGGDEKKDRVTGRTVNSPGYRNFLLFVSEEIAEELKDKGCEIKYTKVQNENDVPAPYVSIIVSYYLKTQGVVNPVNAHMYSNGVDTALDEDHVRMLNDVDINNMCLTVELGKEKTHLNGVRYVPLYAKEIHAEITPNYIAEKYARYASPVYTAPGTEEDADEMPF